MSRARLTDLPGRLSRGESSGTIVTFEAGKVVARPYSRLGEDIGAAAEALRRWGVVASMRVGVRAANCYEWLVFDLALIELRAVSVAFTDDFEAWTADELADRYELGLLLEQGGGEGKARPPFVACMDLSELAAEATADLSRQREADPEFRTPGLIFSTGSSGGVKGMILNLGGVDATIDAFTEVVAPTRTDSVLLFLPISNYQQRAIYYTALWNEADLIIADPPRLFRALKELRPTILVAPPMFYEAFATRYENLPRRRRLLAGALAAGLRLVPFRAIQMGGARWLFQGLYEALGGRVRFMVTGMAPTSISTLRLFARARLPLFETYGMIECGSIAFNRPGARRIGSVGRPLLGVEVKIGEASEIHVRKEHPVTQGYFECAEGEAERTYLSDGWIATGDSGHLDEDGFLHLRGRLKEMIVTRGGRKVHPEALEAEIDSCVDVEKSVVFADGRRGLVAVVVPHDSQDHDAVGRIERHIEQMNKGRSTLTLERVLFSDTPFSHENGLLRPNLKLDRRRIEQTYGGAAAPGTGQVSRR